MYFVMAEVQPLDRDSQVVSNGSFESNKTRLEDISSQLRQLQRLWPLKMDLRVKQSMSLANGLQTGTL